MVTQPALRAAGPVVRGFAHCQSPEHKTKRRRFVFTIDIWDDDADGVIKHVTSMDNFEAACTAYEEMVKRWLATRLIMRQGARVVKDSGARSAIV